MYITVQGPPTAKIGEHISLRVLVFNFWDESLDVLLTIEKSPDYNFVGLNADTISTDPSEPVTGSQQVGYDRQHWWRHHRSFCKW